MHYYFVARCRLIAPRWQNRCYRASRDLCSNYFIVESKNETENEGKGGEYGDGKRSQVCTVPPKQILGILVARNLSWGNIQAPYLLHPLPLSVIFLFFFVSFLLPKMLWKGLMERWNHGGNHSSRKRVKPFKKHKKSRFFEFSKKRKKNLPIYKIAESLKKVRLQKAIHVGLLCRDYRLSTYIHKYIHTT